MTTELDSTGLECDHVSCFIGRCNLRAAKNDGKKGAEANTRGELELVTASQENTPVTQDISGGATWQCCGNSPSGAGRKIHLFAGFFSSPRVPHRVLITPHFWVVLGKQHFI